MYIVFFIVLTFLSSCFPFPDKNRNSYGDISAPVFLGANTEDAKTISFFFNEEIFVSKPNNLQIDNNLKIASFTTEEEILQINLAQDMQAGKMYTAEITVNDKKSNTTLLATNFYGFNNNLPGLVINEFRIVNSATRPEAVELFCTAPGNLAGVTIYRGSSEFFDSRLIFPSLDIVEGDYIVVHFRPENIPEEIDEVDGKNISGGKEAGDSYYDFWVKEGAGLSGTNGCVSLYSNPRGKIIDAICYTNRVYVEGQNYGSFGTAAAFNSINSIFEQGGWTTSAELQITPDDCISITGSTATRTFCRKDPYTNTFSPADWYIVPTGKSTIGTENCKDVYTP